MKQFFEGETKTSTLFQTIQMCVPFHADATANVTLTNQVAAEQFLANSNRNISRVDLTHFNQVRIVARVVTGSVSVNSPRLRVKYAIGFTTVVGSYANIGTGASEVAASLSLSGVSDSGWIAIDSPAQTENTFVTITQVGGNAAADPAVASVMVYFRNAPL
jgi:hypothetical protein